MTTHLGAGAGQSIEVRRLCFTRNPPVNLSQQDAFILGQILADPAISGSNVPAALAIYDTVRRPFGNGVVERSRSTGFLYEFNELPTGLDEEKIKRGDRDELQKLGTVIHDKWTIQWTTMPDVEWRVARDSLANISGSAKFIGQPIYDYFRKFRVNTNSFAVWLTIVPTVSAFAMIRQKLY